ncbi:SDR family oxidoreductase [Sinorhizobium meliloti]|uniref:SDR family oxidoreductase n=1 Tax=Rhizobium meliloti TaxID=382 RepID=UPI003F16EA9D
MPGRTMMDVGRTVVVTGASAGVGRATARRFARAGANVALVARDAVSLRETVAELEAIGAKAIGIPADVADAEAVFTAARQAEERLGPIEVWVNNAMATVFAPFSDVSPEEFRRVTEVTYLGYVHGTMAALRYMRMRDRGVIVQVGSALAYRAIPLQSAYCGAKHAIRGFTDSLRSELLYEGSNIRLTMVQLPAVNTPQFDWARTHLDRQPRPVPPVVQPEAAAAAIFSAAHQRQREVWLGFSTIKVILGNLVVPGYLDRYLARHAYDAQQTSRALQPARRDNLDAPVSELHRTRGSFDAEANAFAQAISGDTARWGAAIFLSSLVAAGSWLVAQRVTGNSLRRRHSKRR